MFLASSGDGNAMIECKGVVRNLGLCPTGEWVLKHNKAGIPYVTDRDETVKKWAMAYFQSEVDPSHQDVSMPMNLSLDRVDDEPHYMAPVHSPKKPQSEAVTPVVGVKSVVPAGH
eukprot:s213_g4.t2